MKRDRARFALLAFGLSAIAGCSDPPIVGSWKGGNADQLSLGGDGTAYLLLQFTLTNDTTNAMHHAEFDSTWSSTGESTYALKNVCRERDDDIVTDCSDLNFTMSCTLPAADPSTGRVSSFSCSGDGPWAGQILNWSH